MGILLKPQHLPLRTLMISGAGGEGVVPNQAIHGKAFLGKEGIVLASMYL